MRRVVTWWLVALGLVLAAPAWAQVDEAKVAAAKEAADELLRRAGDSATTGTMPRRTDPVVAKLLDTVFDLSALGPATVPISRIKPVGELATNANRVGIAYILAGTGKTGLGAGDTETNRQVDRNTVTFAPEVGQFSDFQLNVTTAMAKSALDFVAAANPATLEQPQVKGGLQQMRSGFAQTIGGAFQTLVIKDLDDDWKLRRLATVESISETARRFLGDGEKATVRQIATQVADMTGPELRSRLQAVMQQITAPAP